MLRRVIRWGTIILNVRVSGVACGFSFSVRKTTRHAWIKLRQINFANCIDCSDIGVGSDRSTMQSLNPQFDVLGRLISAADVRQRVISQNIANVNTPNYRRMDVEFESLLAQELSAPGKAAITAQPIISQTAGLATRADGNNVDIDQEIGQLNKNALLQQVYLQLLGTEMNQMRLAIEGS